MAPSPLEVLFVNENVGGHRTMHLHIRQELDRFGEAGGVRGHFLDLPPRSLARRVAGAAVPGLGALDLDLAPLRDQLAMAGGVRRALAGGGGRRRLERCDVLSFYTFNTALLSTDLLARFPSVVGLDATGVQGMDRLPYRRSTRFTPFAHRASMPLERRAYDAATLVLTKSAWAAASLEHDYRVDPDRVRVIPLGVPVPEVGRTRLPDPARLLFVGASMERKGGWRLLDVWRRRLRGRTRLALVTLDDVAPEPGLEVRRDLRPGDPRLLDLLRTSTALVFPTELDTFGYAVLEAMAAGVPVVADRVAALPELVDDGVTGLLVEPGDDGQLGDALEVLLDDPGRVDAMGRAGRARVAADFSARATTAQLVDVLREAVRRFR